MKPEAISGEEFLSWRRRLLRQGGRPVDFDWLLGIGGGLEWNQFQNLYILPASIIFLEKSLEDLEDLWRIHLEKNIPLQYLIGRCPWRDFEIEVDNSVLIPRQETELLIDFALEKFESYSSGCWVDLGTGSGALAVALSRSLPGWSGHAVDCSEEALKVACRNLKKLAPTVNYQVHLGNWWEPLEPLWGLINLVLVNPPYIPIDLINGLDPVVKDHEPLLALDGGIDGLSPCREIIKGAMLALAPDGWLMMEHHHDQSLFVLELMREIGLKEVSCKFDLEGVKRFALGMHP